MATAPRLSIDLSALCENWQKLAIKSGTAKTSAVVKANGYGLGIEPVVEALSMNGCDTFFVATVDEGIRTRLILPNAKIFVLNGIFPETLAETLSNKLIPVLCSIEQIQLWAKNAPGTPSAIHVDTGMTRSGLTLAEAETLAKDTELLRATGGFMVMSHLACGDEPADPLNETQLARFQSIADQFKGFQKSFANSAGIVLGSDYHFDLTRPGISIYGGEATNDVPNPSKQVVKAEARILQIRDAKAGDTVGYGATHTLSRDSKIAVCGIGYADGYHRSASGSGVALRNARPTGAVCVIDGHKAPMLGRVSMDLTTFDVSDIPNSILENTDWVEVFGPELPIDEVAQACGTIGYELLTDLGNRYIREFVS